jgi:hypothetical protein
MPQDSFDISFTVLHLASDGHLAIAPLSIASPTGRLIDRDSVTSVELPGHLVQLDIQPINEQVRAGPKSR